MALLAETERGDVGAHLMTLVRKELIRPDRTVVSGDDGFRFAHILIRDAAYDAIPKRIRASLHEAYAAWLGERMGDEAPYEIVGYHLEQAYRYSAELGAPDASLGARGAARLAEAAKAAGARSDVAAEVNLYGRAIELVPDRVEQPGLLVRLGLALHQAGELERAEEVLLRALAMARNVGNGHDEWMARVGLADLRIDRTPEGGAEFALREGEETMQPVSPYRITRFWPEPGGSSPNLTTISDGSRKTRRPSTEPWPTPRWRTTSRCRLAWPSGMARYSSSAQRRSRRGCATSTI